MINDELIVSIFFTEKGNRRAIGRYLTVEIKEYLKTRYKDFNSYNETIWCIKLGYEEIPICPICKSKHIKFLASSQQGFCKTCSRECLTKLWQQNITKTILEKYGVDNVYASEEFKEKLKKHNLEKYGTEYYMASLDFKDKSEQTNLLKYGVKNGGGSKESLEKIKLTWLERYNVENVFLSEEIKEKIKLTNLEKYGVDHYSKTKECQEKIKNTSLEKYGVSSPMKADVTKNKLKDSIFKKYGVNCIFKLPEVKNKVKKTCIEKYGTENIFQSEIIIKCSHSPEVILKALETKKRNQTFNTSSKENQIEKLLIEKFGENNVKTQYKSELYPFMCDFYLPQYDMYIECNFHWTHGPHLFDENNKDDISLLEKWKSKNTKFYLNAINTWTIRDLKKINCAFKNKLNYKTFYNSIECENFINSLK